MLRRYGRYQGEIQQFELYDPKPKRTDRKQGFYFTAVAEWIDGNWISVCEKCHNFRCLKIDIQKQTWQCSKCDRKGTFRKPEEKSEKKIDGPTEKEEEGMKENYQQERQARGKRKGTFKEKYCYRDEQRKIKFYCLKYENPKGFSQGYYKGDKWISNLKGIRRVLYRLPELIKGKDPVILVEGEKDVDNLRKRFNLTATCNPMGAGKWKVQEKEYNPYLKDRAVFIIPDNDLLGIEKDKIEAKHLVGEKHLIQVATSLKGITKSFKVLRLPDVNDFSDWLEIKGNTEEKFLMLMSEAQDWKDIREETIKNVKKLEKEIKDRKDKEQTSKANTNLKSQDSKKKEKKEKELAETYKAISLTDFLKKTPAEIPYLIGKGLLPKQGYLMIAGKAKEGKTKLALMFALCLALGLPIFFREDNLTGMFPTPEKIKTLYLYREAGGLIGITLESQIKALENLFKIKISKEARDRISLKYPPKELYLDMIPGRVILENIIKANPVDLVVIDPLSKFVARDMNKQPPVIATANLLEEIGRDYNCSFILIHHMNKEPTLDPFDSITGASAWRNCFSSGLVLQRRYEGRADIFKKVTFEFRNAATPDFITVKRDNETSLFFEVTEEEALRGISNVERLVKMIEDNFKEPVSYTKIKDLVREKWGVSKGRVTNLLREAVKKQLLEKIGTDLKTRYIIKTQKDLDL